MRIITIQELAANKTKYLASCSPAARGYVAEEVEVLRAAQMRIEYLQRQYQEVQRRVEDLNRLYLSVQQEQQTIIQAVLTAGFTTTSTTT